MGLGIDRLYNGETNFDFVGRCEAVVRHLRRRDPRRPGRRCSPGASTSASTSRAASCGSSPPGDASVDDARDAPGRRRARRGQGPDARPTTTAPRLRVQAEELAATAEQRRARSPTALAELAGVDVERGEPVNSVGAVVGRGDHREGAAGAGHLPVVITLYITLRFEFKMALATLAALVHDILVTIGVYSITGFEVTPATVIAILTILGYSIYDGIVVFDKVDENTRLRVVDRPR